jgi:hypothetical protein
MPPPPAAETAETRPWLPGLVYYGVLAACLLALGYVALFSD